MPKEESYYRTRWKNAKVRFDMSYGMFDQEKLVGFILNGIDKDGEDFVAFNSGTGVIPTYRGRKIVKAIYEAAIPELKQMGITKCALDVVRINEIAIKAYQGIGFTISRYYKCYAGEIENLHKKHVPLKEILWDQIPESNDYSWENRKASVAYDNYSYYEVYDKTAIGYFVIDPSNGNLPQLDCYTNTSKDWDKLFNGIYQISKKVRIYNVDEKLVHKIEQIERVKIHNLVDQYEMEYKLNS